MTINCRDVCHKPPFEGLPSECDGGACNIPKEYY